MTHEVIMRPGELTVQRGQSTLNKEQSIFMPDGGAPEGANKRVEGPRLESSRPQPANSIFEGLSPAERAHAMSTMSLPGFPSELVRDLGMDMGVGARRIGEIKEGLPAGGEAKVEARAATPPPAAEDDATSIIRRINSDDFTDERFKRIAIQASELVENNSVTSAQIERLIDRARDFHLDGANEAEYARIVLSLRDANAHARRGERFVANPEDIILIADHPKLKAHLEDVTSFLSKIRRESRVDPDEWEALVGTIRTTDMDVPLIDAAHPDALLMTEALNKRLTDFEYAKSVLLGNIANEVSRIEGGSRLGENEKFTKRISALSEAIMTAGESNSGEAYRRIEEIIEGIARDEDGIELGGEDIEDRAYSIAVAEAIRRVEALRFRAEGPRRVDSEGRPTEPELSTEYRGEYDHVINFALEYALERILSSADKNPDEDYPQFSLYVTDNIDRLTHTARLYDEDRSRKYREWYPERFDPARTHNPEATPDMFGYLVNLRSKRRIMHELFRGMRDPNTYLQYVTQLLRKTGFKFVEKDIVGVKETQVIYEQVLSSALALKSQGWLTDQDFARADIDVEHILKKGSERGDYHKKIRTADGRDIQRNIRGWEADRASKMGRSMNAASQRRIVYAVMGDLPDNPDILYKSVESEYIARRLAPLKLFADRFFGQPLAKQLMGIIHRELKRDVIDGKMDYGMYGYVARDPHSGDVLLDRKGEPIVDHHGHSTARGLYGQTQDAADILDLMIVDPKSNSWRGRLMFLAQQDYAKEYRVPDGHGGYKNEEMSLRAYLDTWEQELHLGHHAGDAEKAEFNREIADVIKNQRLYLGILLRHSNLTGTTKEVIWKNAAQFIPSRIAAMFPEETDHLIHAVNHGSSEEEGVHWLDRNGEGGLVIEGLRGKLWRAERLRVANDAEALKKGGSGVTRNLDSFFDEVGFTEKEIEVVRLLQSLGRGVDGKYIKNEHGVYFPVPSAKEIAAIKQPFTAFLDDAPQTDWENLSDEDFNRILVSDQNDFAEGYGHLVGLVADPIVKVEGVVKAFAETFHKIQGPPGAQAAQVRLEAFINAALIQRRATTLGKWTGSLLKDFRMGPHVFPRSLIEKRNMQANIADDEHDQMEILRALAQKEVIADDPHPDDLDKYWRTQYMRMLDYNDANKKSQWKGWFREFMQLLGPVLGKEFLDAFDMKGLGLA